MLIIVGMVVSLVQAILITTKRVETKWRKISNDSDVVPCVFGRLTVHCV